MKLNTVKTLPARLGVALSGGVDSAVLLHRAIQTVPNVVAYFFHHGDDFAEVELAHCIKLCKRLQVPLEVSDPLGPCPAGKSKEWWWSNNRHRWLNLKAEGRRYIATGHHLDDAVELYMMTCINGDPRVMSYVNKHNPHIIHPFLLTPKKSLEAYAQAYQIPVLTDPSNHQSVARRNDVRNRIIPTINDVYGGEHLRTVVKKKILQSL